MTTEARLNVRNAQKSQAILLAGKKCNKWGGGAKGETCKNLRGNADRCGQHPPMGPQNTPNRSQSVANVSSPVASRRETNQNRPEGLSCADLQQHLATFAGRGGVFDGLPHLFER